MAPSHSHKHNHGRRGGHQASRNNVSDVHTNPPVFNSNSANQTSAPTNRKLQKRKYRDTGPLPSSSNTGASSIQNGFSQFSSIPSQGTSSQGANSSEHSGNQWSFTAQATNVNIETDAVTTNSANRPETNTVRNSITSIPKEGLSIPSLSSDLSKQDLELIMVASYVIDLPPSYVEKFLRSLKRRNTAVTKETLLDEILKHDIPRSVFTEQSFPRQNFGDHATSVPPAPPTSNQLGLQNGNLSGAGNIPSSPATLTSASAVQNQIKGSVGNGGIGNARPSEDQVDLVDGVPNSSREQSGNRRRQGDGDNPADVYQNKINNVSSRSSAQDVSSSTVSSRQEPQKTTQNTSVGKSSNQAKVPPQRQTASGAGPASNSNPQSASEDVVDAAAAALCPTQNDLNRESSEIRGTEVTEVPRRPLKMLSPEEHLEMRLKLVQDENKRLDSARLCGQCKVKARDITFLPCGHVWACRSCAGPLYICPCCDKKIIATVDTFLS